MRLAAAVPQSAPQSRRDGGTAVSVEIVAAVRDLYRAHWGEPSRMARFDSGEYEIEIYKWNAEANPEGVNLYATVGASAWPSEEQHPSHRNEFFLGLLPARDEVASPLAALGLYSVQQGVRVDHGHTVPASAPLWPGTHMDTFLVLRPIVEMVPTVEIGGDLHVELLQAIPIFASERAYKATHGPEALLRRWEDRKVQFWDPDRSPEPAAT